MVLIIIIPKIKIKKGKGKRMKLYVGNGNEKKFLAEINDTRDIWKEIDKYLNFETHYHSYRELPDGVTEISCEHSPNFFYYQKD
jgi:hypothetical protein